MNKTIKGRKVYRGIAEGEALVSEDPIAFCAGIDPNTGVITERGHQLNGQSMSGKILIFPSGKGSSAFSKAAYALWLAGKSPIACVINQMNPQTALSSIVMHTPTVTDLEIDPTKVIKTGDLVKVDGNRGTVEIMELSID